MASSNSTLAGHLQSQSTVLGPGIAGLFIQGIGTGLVIAQFSRWFSASERNENVILTVLIIFVTAVGLCVSFKLNIAVSH
jgi:hypothetical protein